MQSRKDQVQAHMFVMGRLTGGMLRQDPDSPDIPTGRTNRGLAWGIGLAVVLVLGFLLYGLISPAGTKTWRTSNALIVQKETGTRYLYLDGVLRPVRNYASARLIAEMKPGTVTVSTASLKGERRGTPVGIPGAPDALPAPTDLRSDTWQVCAAEPLRTGPDGTGRKTLTSLRLGPSADGTAPGRDRAVLVRADDGTRHLLWGDQRLRIGGNGALQALGYSGADPVPVSAAFLSGLPAGPDLVAPEIEGRGTPGGRIGTTDARVGQVFQLRSPGVHSQYFLLEKAGLRPLGALAAALVLGDARTAEKAYPGTAPIALPLTADGLTARQAPSGSTTRDPAGWPDRTPKAVPVAAGTELCAHIRPEATTPRVHLALVPAAGDRPAPPARGPEIAPACLPVDGITVRPGGGALAVALGAGGGVRGTTTYLVTDVGVKHRIGGADAAQRLGLKGARAQAVPSRLLDMLPSGPELSVSAAANGGAQRSVSTNPPCG
ncbi:type VII secretion protein EccB (plasmid) [Streptomyces clavuligerus]|uniref:Putative membrane protein n=12 Tax=Streptomyces clavuligerus TaxID=1901 RepID=D5SI10_STRCL|nr:type VII secretion protein EccB [Streptomyces clavuligerus]EFG03553.1 Putative membrane protein [Streptomyces clavuligerus]MBY6307865.1 type VII secretion protein EccB [Streptomyces clavuligerus]QCS09581.1 type VII secretion protein EccB [Streptomyces clavuligerus]QPJ98367.1 type VII secretion protein EccB [Streptomyces clavuligerus]WDN56304.1 type VII secretion protein EccB [Streptomyces clavuligerus]